MQKVVTVELDTTKHVFLVHRVNEACAFVCRRGLHRDDAVVFLQGI